jgi:hypothetical protein
MQTKLEIITEKLNSRNDIVILAKYETFQIFGNIIVPGKVNMENDQAIGFNHVIFFEVAPVKGLYEVDELQDFMLGLIPGMEFSHKKDFGEHGKQICDTNHLFPGSIFYDEEIGKCSTERTIILSDKNFAKSINHEKFSQDKGVLGEEAILKRKIGIFPYPDKEVAKKPMWGGMIIAGDYVHLKYKARQAKLSEKSL